MYNRKTVYKNFGLDKFISIDDMSNYEKPNPYISDDFLNQEILKQLNSSDQPQFILALSMQNHVIFEANRYSQHPISFQSSLNSYEQPILQSYVDGINLTDQSYLNLKSKLNDIKKPTIVFFFGDHLTFLGKGDDIYQKSGFEITNDLKRRSTPLAAWSNYKTEIKMPKYISPSFLSLEILKAANITPKYQFAYLNSISQSDTVICQTIDTKLSPRQITNYELIQYDLIYGKQYSLQ
jgi:phosphoglycerol transferase MdoB-like AlkP superfamily enzyme